MLKSISNWINRLILERRHAKEIKIEQERLRGWGLEVVNSKVQRMPNCQVMVSDKDASEIAHEYIEMVKRHAVLMGQYKEEMFGKR